MGLERMLRKLIIGEDQFIECYSEFQQAMLSGQFAFLGIIVCMPMALSEWLDASTLTASLFGIVILLLSTSIYCHRIGKHCRANYFLLAPISSIAYLMSTSKSPATGSFIHFVPICIGAFIIFGYRYRYVSFFYSVGIIAVFMITILLGFSILPMRDYTEEQLLFYRTLNFSSALISSIISVYLLIRLNFHNASQLIENNRLLTKTNTELDRFVYSTSHDLRAPLTSILGLINIADLTDDPAAHKKYLGMMKDRIHILDKFIKDITDYSRNNRMSVDIQKVQLSVLVNEIWEMLQYTPEAQNVTFDMQIPADVVIESDISRMKTVLLNLVSNALRYHDPAKQEKYIRLAYHVNGKGFHIKIQDNGQGIDPAYHHRVFDMFFRASHTATGSGLGLYIVKETIAKLSGSIQLESEPGIGSTFTVKLPMITTA